MKHLCLTLIFVVVGAASPALAEETSVTTTVPESTTGSPLYPRVVERTAGKLVIYTPQIESWPDYQKIVGVVAVEATPTRAKKASIGSVKFHALTDTDLEDRVVIFHDPEILDVLFPGLETDTAENMEALVRANVRQEPLEVPLEVVLNYLPDTQLGESVEGMNPEPPPIFTSTEPAVLVLIDGEPILGSVGDTKLQFVVNTNWDLFYDLKKTNWYLLNRGQWLTTDDLAGEWSVVSKLPKDFKKLPNDENWSRARRNVPPPASDEPLPIVFVSKTPAELIVVDGVPELEPIADTGIDHVKNTQSELFVYDEWYYYLVSGRWFTAQGLDGKWSAVIELPEAFKNIPPDHAQGAVRASIPGTTEARLAALEAEIPRKATISRDAGQSVKVTYIGNPQFEPIEGTGLQRAVNTSYDVIQSGENYYLCYNAVWYVSDAPKGPWIVTDKIPAEIYTIPATSPVYHTTHVKVYDSTPTTVSVGYSAGYYGMYVGYGAVMYGTGWYYPPYYYGYYPWPVYYPYPYSYGSSAWYNPATGNYGRGNAVYGPYGGYGRGATYDPQTGAYARGEAIWDNDEVAFAGYGYNPRTGTGVATNRYANEDGVWGESLITRGDEWVSTQGEFKDDRAQVGFETSRGTSGDITRERQGDEIIGESTIERGDRSVTAQSQRTEDGVATEFQGSGGATGQSTKQREDGQVTGSGTIQKGETTVATETQLSRDAARVDLEGSGGASGSVVRHDGSKVGAGQSAEGDLYVGKDGQVFKRADNGDWERHDGQDWQDVAVPERGGGQEARAGAVGSSRAESDRARATASTYDFSQVPSQWESRSPGTRTSQGYQSPQYNQDRASQLNRDYAARQNGYQRHNNYQNRRTGAGRAGGRRRR